MARWAQHRGADHGGARLRCAARSGRHRRVFGLAAAMTALGLALALPAWADLPPHTRIRTPDDGGPPRIEGEVPPDPGRRLADPDLPPEAARAVSEPAAATPTATVVSPAPVGKLPTRPVDRIEVQVGGAWLPDAMMAWFSDRDRHPLLTGLALDASWLHPLSPTGTLTVRAGLVLPQVPDANWWAGNGAVAPLYTQVGLTIVEAAAGYALRYPIAPTVRWTARGELGLLVLAGTVDTIETLPTCDPASSETCPHWRVAGRAEADLPSRVLPTLRATTGLEFQVADRTFLSVEAGLRGTPWLGAGAAIAF